MNPEFMWEMFQIKTSPYQLRMPKGLEHIRLAFRTNFIWNNLPSIIKNSTTLQQFSDLIKNWQGNRCNCKLLLLRNAITFSVVKGN